MIKKLRMPREAKIYIAADILLVIAIMTLILSVKAPAPVRGLEVTGSTYDSVSLAWQPSDDASGYLVFRSEDGKLYDCISSETKESYKDPGLRTEKKYYYKVLSRNGFKRRRGDSAVVSATPMLDVPKLSLDTSKGKVQLHIQKVDGATDYAIYRNDKQIALQPGQEFTDDGAGENRSYSYSVKAVIRDERSEVRAVSSMSEPMKAKLVSAGRLGAAITGDEIALSWKGAGRYESYKVFSKGKLLGETEDTVFHIREIKPDEKYDIRLKGYAGKTESPEERILFSVKEVPMATNDAIDAACEWGVSIADNNEFMYGTGDRAHREGCYFCGTNTGPKINNKGRSLVRGHSYEKTYCCNPFVTACYAHGAGDPAVLKACRRGSGFGMTVSSFTRYGNWKEISISSIKDLKKGDVLVGSRDIGKSKSHHMALYIGDGRIVHARKAGWTDDSIIAEDLTQKRFGKFDFFMRYTGSGRGTKYKIVLLSR